VRQKTQGTKASEDGNPIPAARREELLDELRAIVEDAHDGDQKALSRVREILEELPRLANIFADLTKEAERAVIKRVSGADPLIEEALPVKLKAMRGELCGSNSSPLERLLAERIVACWLQLQYAEIVYAQNLDKLSIPQSEYHQRRLDKLHKRYLAAIKSLAQIRKMGPAVQVNIAEKQINTVGRT
jgi:hypothetical protein